jgi:hypothetical protein
VQLRMSDGHTAHRRRASRNRRHLCTTL